MNQDELTARVIALELTVVALRTSLRNLHPEHMAAAVESTLAAFEREFAAAPPELATARGDLIRTRFRSLLGADDRVNV